jgi:GNAT superfamily N-acetyltransferase
MQPTLDELGKDFKRLDPRLVIANDCPDTIEEWARRGTCIPSKLMATLLADIPEECRITICCQKGGTGRFELRFSSGGERIATATRTFDLNERVVKHAGFSVTPERRGRGLATLLTRNSVDAYREVGITKVTLSAGMDAGGYVWARLGFLPSKDEWRQVRGAVRAKLESIPSVPAEAAEAVRYALADDEATAIWEIADLDVEADGKRLGRLLLSGTAWEGMLDFCNPDAMDRLSAYVAARTGSAT